MKGYNLGVNQSVTTFHLPLITYSGAATILALDRTLPFVKDKSGVLG